MRGSFCPQCGKPTSEQASDASVEERETETEEVFDAPQTVSIELSGLPTADLTSSHSSSNAETVPLQPLNTPEAFHEAPATARLADTVALHEPNPTRADDGSRSRPVRETLGDVKKGFGKVREISTVMLDEASYDPSARFVLVAAVLFILFLIILILSEMMR